MRKRVSNKYLYLYGMQTRYNMQAAYILPPPSLSKKVYRKQQQQVPISCCLRDGVCLRFAAAAKGGNQ